MGGAPTPGRLEVPAMGGLGMDWEAPSGDVGVPKPVDPVCMPGADSVGDCMVGDCIGGAYIGWDCIPGVDSVCCCSA